MYTLSMLPSHWLPTGVLPSHWLLTGVLPSHWLSLGGDGLSYPVGAAFQNQGILSCPELLFPCVYVPVWIDGWL